jgi:hypothetical protein
MNLQDLQEIKSELKRFSDTIDEAILLAKTTTGYVSNYDGNTYGKHDISGTRLSGAVKRRAQDLKYYLTKKL